MKKSSSFTLFLAIFFVLTTAQLQAQIINAPSEAKSSTPIGGAPQMYHDTQVKQTGWPSIPMPKITMPKITMPDMTYITAPIKSGYTKVSTGTKKVWEGTKEMFTFGGGDKQASTSQSTQPPHGFWGSLFSSEPKQDEGPKTVGEWMAQPRLEP